MTLVALVRRDVLRVLWRPRSLLLVLYIAAGAWIDASIPTVEDGDGTRQMGVAITDAIPHGFLSNFTLVAVQALVVVFLTTALIVEDRAAGGTWMTVHRAGGRGRWWTGKLAAAVAIAAVVIATSALLILVTGLARGWDLTLSVSEYARAGSAGYGRIGDTSPLIGSVIVVILRVAVMAVLALFTVAVAVVVRRDALAYAVPLILLLVYWRLAFRALPESYTTQVDLLGQALWDQHNEGFDVSWWWTPPVLAAWALAALTAGRVLVARVEVTE